MTTEPVTRAGVVEEVVRALPRERSLEERPLDDYAGPNNLSWSAGWNAFREKAIRRIRALAHSEPVPAPVVLKAAGTFYDDPRPAPATPPVNEITVHSGDGQSFTLLFNAEEECQPVILDRHFAEELSSKLSAALAPATPVSDVTEDKHLYAWLYPYVGDDGLTRILINEVRRFAARRSGGVADGWQLVPKEPTEAMLKEGRAARNFSAMTIYRAMLAAAPSGKEQG